MIETNAPRTVTEATIDWIDGVVRDLCEIPDRNSPDDAPEMLIVTAEEVRCAIERNLTSADGSLTVDDAVAGVLGLFPGADVQALRCLGMLMAKTPNALADGPERR